VWAIGAAVLGLAAVVGYALAREPVQAPGRLEPNPN
jgi:hypothetical protein